MRKKFWTRAVICALCAAFCLTGLTACEKEDPASTLYIDISNAGYGIDWLNPLAELFEADHPGITVKVRDVVKNDSNYMAKCLSGVADTDLFFLETSVLKNVETPVNANGVRYEHPFMDLTDLFHNVTIPGEDQTIAQKMRPEYLAFNTIDGRNYTFPWMESMMGFVMNKNAYKESWGKLNTTDELFEFCENAKKDGYSPFIYSINDPYYLDIYDLWMTQYHGMENMAKFYDGYALSGRYEGERYIPQMFLDDGLLAALEVLDRLVNYDNGYQDRLSYTLSFTAAQNTFLETDSKIVFMATGTWMQREMEMNYDPDEINSEFVRMPVVSALGVKLGISDEILSQIIDYADGNAAEPPSFTSTKGLDSEDVVAEVVAARKIVPSNHLHAAFIPSYSTKGELAKEFILLMASDRGIRAMLEEEQVKPPMQFDTLNSGIELSDFMKSVYRLADDSVFDIQAQGDLFRKGGLALVNNQGYFTKAMGAANPDDRKDAEDIYLANYDYVSDDVRWQYFLTSAGIQI